MIFDKDVAVPVSDGLVLRANIFRPPREGRFPVVMAQGIYGKDAHFADAFKPQWEKLLELYPGLCSDGSSGRYLRWETVDPERWVPDDYVVIQVDARGSGKSPGFLDPYAPREIQDYCDAIEWAAHQAWSNGKVGLIGISYYAITQWLVAALRPPHLAAIVPWEGASDHYRDWSYHGGLLSGFVPAWWPRQALENQHGNAASTHFDRETNERSTGAALSDVLLAGNRADYPAELLRHPLDDEWHRQRSPDLSRIEVPVLSAGNWGGPGVHLRGNIEGYMRCGSRSKWLSMHVGTHFESFYLPEYVSMQKCFLDRYLKDVDNGWEREAPVQLSIRRPGGACRRMEQEFPLARTTWTRLFLAADDRRLSLENPDSEARVAYHAMGAGVTFSTAPFKEDAEITGFITLRLTVASSTTDMDIFATLRAFRPDGTEVIFDGAHEPTPVSRGWLRASQRALDPERSTPYRVYHSHRAVEKLTPDTLYTIDVEMWPTSMVFPSGYRLAITIAGRDFEIERIPGRILHQHPANRGSAEFGGTNTIVTGGAHESYVLLPVIA
jgi:predicted acyl esterase